MIISSPGPSLEVLSSLHQWKFAFMNISSFSHKPLDQLKPVLAEMVLGWSSICYMIINSFGFKMAAMLVNLCRALMKNKLFFSETTKRYKSMN